MVRGLQGKTERAGRSCKRKGRGGSSKEERKCAEGCRQVGKARGKAVRCRKGHGDSRLEADWSL